MRIIVESGAAGGGLSKKLAKNVQEGILGWDVNDAILQRPELVT